MSVKLKINFIDTITYVHKINDRGIVSKIQII